ncbi:ABC transporter substrate-binding protein [Heyndrickxia shackletonii]|uniref:ABC transporter substrate-binding protein n=1 Tax=Heyndrickxia shackletonii TaxID=157838 RepID=A0A0Q3TE47_9BACI|nr:ABC transporter substrate-binding protein [Heyndrickxia shackletonii]KQL52376.1 ABC transporter substrate-binding protein [Heyndrickxia shackletonii]MBB2479151.1 ABC transporter substrate-binding protein [Bacillus sp. APMAM]NEY99065.1 ABC transporter substrate-binding protein [Heyndrickxia shackletonii]RTZ57054.1 ABC transporter substrate-binding protein [Bacillus sp. SAJ1]
MRKQIGLFAAILLSFVLVLSGCSSNSSSTSSDKTNGSGSKSNTFIYGISGDPGNSVNVITTGDRFGLMEIKAIYSPLYMYNGKDDVKYFLATSMTPSKDFKTYTAKLRKDVKWSDGKPFTADDVVFTYDQMLKESNGGWARSMLIFNNKPVKVVKVDDYTVKFELPEVSMGAMESLGNIFIMPKHIYEGEKDIANSSKNATPVGTGPYKLVQYKAGESVTFEKNKDYFLGAPKIDKVVFRIIEDANTANISLQSGEINALIIQPSDVAKFKNDSKVTLKPYDEGRIGYMAFNLSSKAVQSKEVRQAIAYALNRDEIIKASYLSNDYAEPAYTFLPRKATYYTENVDKHDFNVNKSKELLKKAGVEGLSLKLAYIGSDPIQQKQAAVMQQDLKAVGIDLKLVGMDANALSQKLEKVQTDFDMYLNGFIMGIDPDTFNSLFVTGSPSNYMHYSNPEVDDLFNKGRVETNDAKRQAIYEKIQKLIIDDAAFYPITENKRILAIDSNITGIDQAGLVPVYTFEDMSKLSFK